MTTSGKVLGFLVVISAGVGVWLMATCVNIHNGWMASQQTAQANVVAKRAQIESETGKLANLQNEYDRLIQRWYRVWDTVNSVSNGDGTISIDAGTNQGVPALDENQVVVLYAFRPNPNAPEESVFVKSFNVTDVQQDRSSLKANGYTTEAEIESWEPGNWRFWQMIPEADATTLSGRDNKRAEMDLVLSKQERNLASQKELVIRAQKMLESRHHELDGNPNVQAGDALPVELKVGLIKALEQYQNEHLEVLQEVDQLRREIKVTTDEITQLLGENEKLVAKLPQ